MFNVKNMLYMIIFIVDMCQSLTFFDHQKHFNTLITPVAMITNKNLNGLLDETMVQYGSIIHHRYVLTFAEILEGKHPNDLLVRIDCYSDWFIFKRSCSNFKQISRFKFIVDYYVDSTEIKYKYGIIILKDSILFSSRINIVRLVTNDDIVDKSNCLIYSYIHHESSDGFVSYVTPVKFQERDGIYLPTLTKVSRLFDDNDREMELERIMTEVNFYGSPIMCSLKNSSNYIQVGISNLKIVYDYSRLIIPFQANQSISELSVNFSPEEIKQILSSIPRQIAETYSVSGILS